MFVTLNYTYSAFKNTIVGTISGNAKDWVFKVNVDSGTVYNDSYKVHLTGTSGSFNVRISTVGGAKNAEYSIELTGNDLVKYYTDSTYTNLIENNSAHCKSIRYNCLKHIIIQKYLYEFLAI